MRRKIFHFCQKKRVKKAKLSDFYYHGFCLGENSIIGKLKLFLQRKIFAEGKESLNSEI